MTGVRQSRRLAAFAEAPSHIPSDPHAAQQQGTAPHQQGKAPHQHRRAPQQAEQPAATQSAALLQASTLEASANVLKSLVRAHNDWFRVYIGYTMAVRHAAQGLGYTVLPKPSTYTALL